MVTLAILVSQVASESSTGKADARLNAGVQTVTNLYRDTQAESTRAAASLAAATGADPAAVAALESGRAAEVDAVARDLAGRAGIAAVELEGAGGATAAAG